MVSPAIEHKAKINNNKMSLLVGIQSTLSISQDSTDINLQTPGSDSANINYFVRGSQPFITTYLLLFHVFLNALFPTLMTSEEKKREKNHFLNRNVTFFLYTCGI